LRNVKKTFLGLFRVEIALKPSGFTFSKFDLV